MTSTPPLRLQPERTALILVDLQRGVVGGLGAGLGLLPHKAGDVVANARRLAVALRDKGGLVVLASGSMGTSAVPYPSPAADVVPPAPGEVPPGWLHVVPELADVGAHLLHKHQWGSFYGTELEPLLRRRGVTTLLLGGVATNLGVESTAREAYDRGYTQVFVEDGMTAFDGDAHQATVTKLFPLIGRVRDTAAVLDALA